MRLSQIPSLISKYFYWLSLPSIRLKDIIEIVIISFFIYQVIKWVQQTRAWTLLRGLVVLLLFALAASMFQLNTISWLLSNSLGVGITAAIIIFQPELRRALEQLGRRNFIANLFAQAEEDGKEILSERDIIELVKASFEMGKAKTGALMVIERGVALGEYERTGIPVDAILTRQLLINIFEHNTPLHDGAIIIKGNRVASATCYLPLTDRLDIGKELGTRHRAAVGISEVSDSITIVVSEETGSVSVAQDGVLYRSLSREELTERLHVIVTEKNRKRRDSIMNVFSKWKGLLRKNGRSDVENKHDSGGDTAE